MGQNANENNLARNFFLQSDMFVLLSNAKKELSYLLAHVLGFVVHPKLNPFYFAEIIFLTTMAATKLMVNSIDFLLHKIIYRPLSIARFTGEIVALKIK
jgi:hypothetical protein